MAQQTQNLVDYEGIDTLEYTTTLASNNKVVITGPGVKDWFISKNVGKKAYDMGEMIDAIMKSWLLHPDTTWNIPLPRTEKVIDTKLLPGDVDTLAAELAKKFWPEIFATDLTSADPNDEESATMESTTETSTPEKSDATSS